MTELSVGFVGLGDVGHAMAARLSDLPGGLTVFDTDVSTAAPLVMRGALMASSVPHLAESCEVVCVRVGNDEQTRSVVTELLLSAHEGATIVLHTAVRPATAVELAEQAAVVGVHLLDAAVIGPPSAAEQGRLALLVGGPQDRFDHVAPLLERMAELVVHVGEVGAGSRARLARTMLQYVGFVAAAEAGRLAEAAGISPAVLGRIVRHADTVIGGPGAVLWRDTTAPMTEDDPWREVFTRLFTHGERELAQALELADQLSVRLPLGTVAVNLLAPALGFQQRGGEESAVTR